MKKTTSSRDYELLSLYLDGQLNTRQLKTIESRLIQDSDLQNELESMRQVRNAIRRLPAVPAPRSFKLSPEMVGRKQSRPVYPAFQFAAAFATLVLVVLLAWDYLGPRPMSAAVLAPAAPQAAGSVYDATSAAMDASATTVASATSVAEATVVAGAPAAAEGTAGPGMESQALEAPTPELSSKLAETPPSISSSTEITSSPPIGVFQAPPQPLSQTDTITSAQPEASNLTQVQVTTEATPRSPFLAPGSTSLRWAELSLAFLVVVTALSAFFLRRKFLP